MDGMQFALIVNIYIETRVCLSYIYFERRVLMNYEAIIFDCDGVLVDSEPHSCYAWNILFEQKYNVDIGTDYSAVLGKNGIDAAKYYCNTFQIPFSNEILQQLSMEKEEIYYQLARNTLKAIPGVKELIHQAQTLQFKMAVASSGTREKISFNLEQAGLTEFFAIIIDTSLVERGKPDPSLFLLAAAHLGVPIEKCIIIEDSVTGILAGKRSGAFTIALASTFPIDQLQKADLILHKFSDLNLKKITQR
jgi:HAD superfamily hydrolase (TIGR01509 family)